MVNQPWAGGKAGQHGRIGQQHVERYGDEPPAHPTEAGATHHVLKGAGAKAMERDRTTTLETQDGAGQKDMAVNTAGHPVPQRTRRRMARNSRDSTTDGQPAYGQTSQI